MRLTENARALNSNRKTMTFMDIFSIIMTTESIQMSLGLKKKWNDSEKGDYYSEMNKKIKIVR